MDSNQGLMCHPADPHSCHVGFAKAAGFDLRYIPPFFDWPLGATVVDKMIRGLVADIPEAPVFLISHGDILFTAPKIRQEYPEATILYLFAQGELFDDRYNFSRSGRAKIAIRRTNTAAIYYFSKIVIKHCIDGIIVNSEYMYQRVRNEITETIPVEKSEPYISDERYERLSSCNPDYSSKTVLTLGRDEQTKGTDILIEAWKKVQEKHPDATLLIAGEGHTEYDISGIKGLGFVSDIESVIEQSSLYVHPSRMEAFGVSVVEAMRGGLPTVVTNRTGSKSVVQEVDDSFIVQPSAEELAIRIAQYLETKTTYRHQLGEKFRVKSTPFNRRTKSEIFVSAIDNLK